MTISTDNKCFKQNLDHNPITLPPYNETFCGKISDGKILCKQLLRQGRKNCKYNSYHQRSK